MSGRRLALAAMLAATVLIAAPVVTRPAPRLIWNASASVPIGLYLANPADGIDLGDLVAATPPAALAPLLSERGYLPLGVPLIKRVQALPSARVCRIGLVITVDGVPLGAARDRDRAGRDLPVWRGCRLLAEGEVLLMNRDVPDSLDGRYFGPSPTSSIIARLVPIWTGAERDGRFEGRASMR